MRGHYATSPSRSRLGLVPRSAVTSPVESRPLHRVAGREVANLCKLVSAWDVTQDALLEGLDIAPAELAKPSTYVSLASWLTVIERARTLSGEPALGIHMGLRSTTAMHGFIGYGAMSAANLSQSIRFFLRYASLRLTAIEFSGHVEDDLAVMTLEEKADFGSVRDVQLLSLMIGLWQDGSAVLGRRLRLRLDLPIARPDYFARFEHVLPPTRFNRAKCQLSGPADGLRSPVTLADAATFELIDRECERLCGTLDLHASLEAQLRRALPRDRGFRSFAQVARELGVSPRTLRRRMTASGLSYPQLIDEERKTRALILLSSDGRTLDDVAARLGYSDASTFARAFRRWAGCSPAAYRRDPNGRG
jgi:AraC-like DNA-binding protein